jgi:dihydrofolate reductase
MLTAIVAVSPDWGIGCGDELLYKDMRDLWFFSGFTQEKELIVGYRTAQTLPKMTNRELIVLHREDIDTLETYSQAGVCWGWMDDKVVIGGAKTYKLLAEHVDLIYVTHFFNLPERKADVFFPIEDYPWIVPENGVKIVSNKEFEIVLYRRNKDGI